MSVSGGYINHMVGVPRNMSQTSFFGACPIGWGEGKGASYGHITLPFVGPICVSAVWLAAWNIQGPVKSDLMVGVKNPPPPPPCSSLYKRLTSFVHLSWISNFKWFFPQNYHISSSYFPLNKILIYDICISISISISFIFLLRVNIEWCVYNLVQ